MERNYERFTLYPTESQEVIMMSSLSRMDKKIVALETGPEVHF
jgi:hypothetical protein